MAGNGDYNGDSPLRGRRSARCSRPFASDLLLDSERQVFTQNSLDRDSDV